jgi:hypothetical protein
MKVLAITAFFLAGCATATPGTSTPANKLSLEQAEQNVDRSAERCVERVVMRSDDQMSNVVMTLGPLTQMQIVALLHQREVGSSQCVANADKGAAAIAERERNSYENATATPLVPLPVVTMSFPK